MLSPCEDTRQRGVCKIMRRCTYVITRLKYIAMTITNALCKEQHYKMIGTFIATAKVEEWRVTRVQLDSYDPCTVTVCIHPLQSLVIGSIPGFSPIFPWSYGICARGRATSKRRCKKVKMSRPLSRLYMLPLEDRIVVTFSVGRQLQDLLTTLSQLSLSVFI